ncbi:MAG: hypothetical protein HFI33_13365 [Lachnospiraceae bacterium]|nr:hypothetical protein [Lachnospiraceae bacterium]
MTEVQEMQKFFIKYIRQYIQLLTRDREEFFLSLCDLEEEPLELLRNMGVEGAVVLVVEHNDYAEAVCVRNDPEVKRIVLLSAEGVKQMDSLKDFHEYSVKGEDQEGFWGCMETAFSLKVPKRVRDFLDVILNEGEVTFWEFFTYICSCVVAGQLNPGRMNRNLPKLGIWGLRGREILTKGEIRRMIRVSKDEIIERRLTKALMDNRIKKGENIISTNLARGDIQTIRERVSYGAVKEFLKGPERGGEGDMPASGDASEEKRQEQCSYAHWLEEQPEISLEELEQCWLEDREEEEQEWALDWGVYSPLGSLEAYEEEFQKLGDKIREMNIPEERICMFLQKLTNFREAFTVAYPQVVKWTPICLKGFCDQALAYTQAYLELLSFALSDQMIRQQLLEAGIVSGIENLFCEWEGERIRMPFYHPVCVLYFMGLQKMYGFALEQKGEKGIEIPVRETLLGLIKKLGMRFPVSFLSWQGQLYALDYTTIWNRGAVEFTSTQGEVTYSALDVRMIQKQITDYLLKHPLVTEVTVALVEISDLSGFPQLVDKIRQISDLPCCNIGRVVFRILSSREEELKKQLAGMWETMGTDDLVRFRFGRKDFRTPKGYDMEKIVFQADLVVLADSSVLYYEPHLERFRAGGNALQNRLSQIRVEEQTDLYFTRGASDTQILWDSLQKAEQSREEGFWKWKSRELDSRVLSYINQVISADSHRTVVMLSSNTGILDEIYKDSYIQAHRKNDNGKSITLINFARDNRLNQLPVKGEARICYSLSDFYKGFLEIPDMPRLLAEEIEDIDMELYLEEGEFHSLCTAYVENWEQADQEWRDTCGEWLTWNFEKFPKGKNILIRYFMDLWINYWSEGVRSVPAGLMVHKLFGGGDIITHYQEKELEGRSSVALEYDCMEAVTIQEILRFIDDKAVMDSQSAQQYCDKYDPEMLRRIWRSEQKKHILEEKERKKLLELKKLVELREQARA